MQGLPNNESRWKVKKHLSMETATVQRYFVSLPTNNLCKDEVQMKNLLVIDNFCL